MPTHPWEAAVTNDSPADVTSGTPASADPTAATDPLPSWNEGPAKQSVLSFVDKVTREGSPYFVPVPERIATFDNDGTLWCEQPAPAQAYFALDRVKALASQHPEWETGAVRLAAHGGLAGRARRRRSRASRNRHGHPRGHEHRGVRANRRGLDRHRQASGNRQALHRDDLSADARAARLPARHGSGTTSSRAVASSSCANGVSASTASHPSR